MDKVYPIKESTLKAIADSIREKTNTTYDILVENMPSAISSIETSATEDRLADFLSNKFQTLEDNTITHLGSHALYKKKMDSINLPNLRSIGENVFEECDCLSYNLPQLYSMEERCFYGATVENISLPSLIHLPSESFMDSNINTLDIPNVVTAGSQCFGNCANLFEVTFPNMTRLRHSPGAGWVEGGPCTNSGNLVSASFPMLNDCYGWGSDFISNCTQLEHFYAPLMDVIHHHDFYGCYKLEYLDLPSLRAMDGYPFVYCHSLKALMLRNNTLVELPADPKNVFERCYHILGHEHPMYNPEQKTDGFIYVPETLLNEYREATNWSGLKPEQFRAIEHYTVDGTLMGQVNWESILNEVV